MSMFPDRTRFVLKQDRMKNGDPDDDSISLPSRRVGGRARRKSPIRKVDKLPKIPGWLKTFALPIAIVWILGQVLFGRGDTSSDYYYYQSSVYESSVYGSDGRVDTARKSSVRSNVPGLIDRSETQQKPLPAERNSIVNYERRADEDFDKILDQEIESMMRLQKGFMNDFW